MKNKNNSSQLFLKALRKFVLEKNIYKVRDVVQQFHPADLVPLLNNWKIEWIISLLRMVDKYTAGELLNEFDDSNQEKILKLMPHNEIKRIFNKIHADETVDIVDDIDQETRNRVLKSMDQDVRKKISKQLSYKKNLIGYHMHHEFISIEPNITVKQANEIVKKEIKEKKKEIAGDIFVKNKQNKIVGYVKIEDLVTQNSDQKISEFIKQAHTININSKMRDAISLIKKYDIPTLPVVDKQETLLGVIEAADIIDHLHEDLDVVKKASMAENIRKQIKKEKDADKVFIMKLERDSKNAWKQILLLITFQFWYFNVIRKYKKKHIIKNRTKE